MEIKKFESINNSQPYSIGYNGELKKTIDHKADVYLTDKEYERIKDFADNVKKICDTLDEKKRLEIIRLKLVIAEIKKPNVNKEL